MIATKLKSGFITPLIILGAIAALFYFYLIPTYSVGPTQVTTVTAQTFLKYPKAANWNIKNIKYFCPFNFLDCMYPPVEITFESRDPWSQVYQYYLKGLEGNWETKSEVITSTPTKPTFTNKQGCKVIISEKDASVFDRSKEGRGLYEITLNCR